LFSLFFVDNSKYSISPISIGLLTSLLYLYHLKRKNFPYKIILMKLLRIVLLFPLAGIYWFITTTRNILFDIGILPSETFEKPIICIGNLSTGGTGKTPHTEYLIKQLKDKFNVAVLSRGYRRKTKNFILSTSKSTAQEIGDEPRQMKQKFPQVTVAVDADRRNGVKEILKNEPNTDLILLDDAFQHRYVKPDFSILLTDLNNIYTNDFILPAGNLRESRRGMNRAKYIIVTKCPENFNALDRQKVIDSIRLKKDQQIFFTSYQYKKAVNLWDNKKVVEPFELIDNKTDVLLITGIAKPKPIVKYLQKFTNNIKHISFSDHHEFSEKDLEKITDAYANLVSEKRIIITTEKDAQRLSILMKKSHDYIYYLPIEVIFTDNNEEIFINQIIKHVSSNKKYSRVY